MIELSISKNLGPESDLHSFWFSGWPDECEKVYAIADQEGWIASDSGPLLNGVTASEWLIFAKRGPKSRSFRELLEILKNEKATGRIAVAPDIR